MFVMTFCCQVSVYAPPELIDQTEYALIVATSVLEFYENYYGVSYPLQKSGKFAIQDIYCSVVNFRNCDCVEKEFYIYYFLPFAKVL